MSGGSLEPRAADGTLSPERVRMMFDRIAGPYDKMNRAMTAGLDRRWRALAADEANIGLGANVVDVCCGTGDLALELAGRVGAAGEVTGIDFSENMLQIAREKAVRLNHPNVRFLPGDALDLPVGDDEVAAATIAFGMRNLADHAQGFRELVRVVRPGGPRRLPRDHDAEGRRAGRLLPASGSIGSCRRSATSSTGATRRTRTCRPRCGASRGPTSSARSCTPPAWSASRYRTLAGGIIGLHVGEVPK